VPPPAQPPPPGQFSKYPQPVPPPTQPAVVAQPPSDPKQNIARLQEDIAGIKAGEPVTPEQKQQLVKDLAFSIRGTKKPSLPTVTKFVETLTAALAEKQVGAPEQARLAQDLEFMMNCRGVTAEKYDATVADVQAIMQVGGTKRDAAVKVAGDLKAIGAEIRR